MAIFTISLRSSYIDAIVILFLNFRPSGRCRDILRQNDIIAVVVDNDQLEPEFIRKYHPSSTRWILYDRLLHAAIIKSDEIVVNKLDIEKKIYQPTKPRVLTEGKLFNELFNRMLVLDVRDSAFQRNPFSSLPELHTHTPARSIRSLSKVGPADRQTLLTLYAFGEDEGSSIVMCGWNSKWVQDCFTDQVLSVVGNNVITCSGVSLGYNHAIVNYIHSMSVLLLGKTILSNSYDEKDAALMMYKYTYPYNQKTLFAQSNYNVANRNTHTNNGLTGLQGLAVLTASSQFPQCERNGVDQGIHNVLLYLNVVPAQIVYPQSFPVVNLQNALPMVHYSLETSEMLSIPKRTPFAVVHQYDRNMQYQKILIDKFVRWVNLSDPIQEWKASPHCARFEYIQEVDMLRAKCDLRSQRAMTLATCCELCNKFNRRPDEISVQNNYNQDSVCTGFTFTESVCYFKQCSKAEVKKAFIAATALMSRNQHLAQPGAISAFQKMT